MENLGPMHYKALEMLKGSSKFGGLDNVIGKYVIRYLLSVIFLTSWPILYVEERMRTVQVIQEIFVYEGSGLERCHLLIHVCTFEGFVASTPMLILLTC